MFYEFRQNNSGGYFDEDENVSHFVIIEADTEEQAIEIFEPMIENQSSSCPCCGDRWYLSPSEIDLPYEMGASLYTSVYPDYKKLWNEKYGKYKRKEEPKKEDIGVSYESWGTSIYFDTIQEYAEYRDKDDRFVDNSVRVHFLNGTKLGKN